jgi:hypothetical protein
MNMGASPIELKNSCQQAFLSAYVEARIRSRRSARNQDRALQPLFLAEKHAGVQTAFSAAESERKRLRLESRRRGAEDEARLETHRSTIFGRYPCAEDSQLQLLCPFLALVLRLVRGAGALLAIANYARTQLLQLGMNCTTLKSVQYGLTSSSATFGEIAQFCTVKKKEIGTAATPGLDFRRRQTTIQR